MRGGDYRWRYDIILDDLRQHPRSPVADVASRHRDILPLDAHSAVQRALDALYVSREVEREWRRLPKPSYVWWAL